MALAFPGGRAGRLLLSAALLLRGVSATPSVAMAYCASINTGSTSANSSIYQSDGLCHDFCQADNYAYAVIQDKNCWCSDYTPSQSTTVDTSECNTPCSGYPTDWCGGDGLFGYMALSKAPAGTAGGSSTSKPSSTTSTTSTSTSSTTSTTSTTSSSSTTPTTLTTSTLTTSTTATSTSTTSTSTTSTSSSTSTSSTSSSTTHILDPTATTPVVHTVTAGGTVQTVTVTPSATGTAEAANANSKHKGISTGAAVGIAIGVVAAAVLGAIVVFCLWRRKRQQHEKDDALFPSGSNPPPRGGSPKTPGAPAVTETSAGPAFARRPGVETDQSGRRRSALMPIDPRIDPGFSGIYSRSDNKSRDSVNSLRDDHDYSRRVHQPDRVLRATNPDPADE